jgi:hypothetical protein
MSEELHNLEAQILAWLDGELDATAAAELERKLSASPEHQHLLADLRRQQDLLRALPRTPAPAELAQRLQSQLAAEARPQMSPWLRRYRLAASVLLMVGVGTVALQMLPRSGRQAPLALQDSRAREVEVDGIAMTGRPEEPLGGAAGTQAAFAAALADSNQTVIYLSSTDFSRTSEEVASVLRDNGVRFSQADNRLAGASGFNSFQAGELQEYSARQWPASPGAPAAPVARRDSDASRSYVGKGGDYAAKGEYSNKAAAAPPATHGAPARVAAEAPSNANEDRYANLPAVVPQRAPSPTLPSKQMAGDVGAVAAEQSPKPAPAAEPATPSPVATRPPAPGASVQARDLKDDKLRGNAGAQAALQPEAQTDAQPAAPQPLPSAASQAETYRGKQAHDAAPVQTAAEGLLQAAPGSQQIFLARNVSEKTVAEVEKALQRNARVLNISNSRQVGNRTEGAELGLERASQALRAAKSNEPTAVTRPAEGIDLLIVVDAQPAAANAAAIEAPLTRDAASSREDRPADRRQDVPPPRPADK